jgi:hypothetical protein
VVAGWVVRGLFEEDDGGWWEEGQQVAGGGRRRVVVLGLGVLGLSLVNLPNIILIIR